MWKTQSCREPACGPKGHGRQGDQVSAAGVEILEYFDRERKPLGLKQITGALGYPLSSSSALRLMG
jgi:hypothetical protein